MDVVYLCREGANEELRYSLRSLSNVPHGRVWIFGGAPDWINPETVTVVRVPQEEFGFKNAWKVKYENVRRNLMRACDQGDVSDEFLYMNDDFYVTEELHEIPILHYGGEDAFCAWFKARQSVPSSYVLAEQATLQWCRDLGVEDPNSYALHVPLPVDKGFMGHMLEQAPWEIDGYPLHMRTAYGNLNEIGGVQANDVKVERGTKTGIRRMNGVRISGPVMPTKKLPTPFASSSDRSFLALDVGRWVRAKFPTPSIYES